jgi:type IV secretion system protein VirB10
MVQSLQLGGPDQSPDGGMKRLNRLPLYIGAAIVGTFLAVLVYGLSSRGLHFGDAGSREAGSQTSAASFAEQLKRGVKDGIIGEREAPPPVQQAPAPARLEQKQQDPARRDPVTGDKGPRLEAESDWRAKLRREGQEQLLREQQRQQMASLQARATALDAPLKVNTASLGQVQGSDTTHQDRSQTSSTSSSADAASASLRAAVAGGALDQNGQTSKEDFLNSDIKALGYLPNGVVQQRSRYELKRGSVIPATMITGINSDLPGRISAQVSQNVFDSATGRLLLIPQGSKLFGRYDSKVSFGQNRVLVVWTDLVFPNGATLQIGSMAGTDAEGYSGFEDEVDHHYFRTFGSAVLVALIGTGIDMAVPQGSTLATQTTASDAARRNFAESFGRVAEQTVTKNLNVQPTIEIRPGYIFNVLVDQDMIFPGVYGG